MTSSNASQAAAKMRAALQVPYIPPSTKEQERLTRFWMADVWNFLTGRDVDGRPIIHTSMGKVKIGEPSTMPFPTDKPYLKRWARRVVSALDEDRLLLCDKPRQMIITTTTLLAIRWWCAKQESVRWLISKRVAKEAEALLAEKVREVQHRMPEWMQDAGSPWWISDKPKGEIRFPNDSAMEAVAMNVAAGAGRGKTVAGIFVDEAAFQTMFGEIWSATEPMAGKLIGVSTPNNDGNPGATAWNELLDEGKPLDNPYTLDEEEDKVEPSPFAHDGDPTAEDYD